MNGWEIAAISAGGLFTAATVFFAVNRVPRWRQAEVGAFLPDFAKVIHVADKVQPTLLVSTIISVVMLSRSIDGTTRAIAVAATIGFTLTLIGSVAYMVPLQRRMIRLGDDPAVPQKAMRARWIKGQLGRASLSVASYALLALSVAGVG